MSRRSERIRFKIVDDHIRGFVDYNASAGVSESMYYLPHCKVSPTVICGGNIKLLRLFNLKGNDTMEMTTFKVGDKTCVALVRKLTEKECGRLMDVDDKDIDTIANCGVSRSAQYKMYGNSIVEAVLYHIFRKAFIETENESQQMTIFDLM